MALIYAEMKLGEIILNEPTLIPVINRFGIRLGVGDKTVRVICEEEKLDTDFFLVILNTFMNAEYFPERRLKTFCAAQIVDYLTKTNAYYERFQLPNIERHLNSLIERTDAENTSLELIKKFFTEFKKELLSRIEEDRTNWFPAIRSLSDQLKENKPEGHDMPLEWEAEEQDSLEAKLNDLQNLLIKHLNGDFDPNLCYAVIFALYTLEKDIRQHNRIRNRILEPIYKAMNLIRHQL